MLVVIHAQLLPVGQFHHQVLDALVVKGLAGLGVQHADAEDGGLATLEPAVENATGPLGRGPAGAHHVTLEEQLRRLLRHGGREAGDKNAGKGQ